MSRKDFISDHLVDMRAQLRDSYASYHQGRALREEAAEKTVESGSAAQQSDVAGQTDVPVHTEPQRADKYLPAMRVAGDNSGNARERRELEGRIIHDLAVVDCKRGKLQQKLNELEGFSAVLESAREEIANGDVGEIGRKYYAARGRWSAFENDSENTVQAPVGETFDRKGFWIVAVSILLGSLVVALSLTLAFSV